MTAFDIADQLPGKPYKSRRAFYLAMRRYCYAYGIGFGRALYDDAGNCRFCGEAGRCPGIHTLEEICAKREQQ